MSLYLKLPEASGQHDFNHSRWEALLESGEATLYGNQRVEILSPSNTRAEMDEKRELYFEIGCLEFWTVGATGKVRFFGAGGADLAGSEICPGFPGRVDL